MSNLGLFYLLAELWCSWAGLSSKNKDGGAQRVVRPTHKSSNGSHGLVAFHLFEAWRWRGSEVN